MAKTFVIEHPAVVPIGADFHFVVRKIPEGATQTFPLGSFLQWSSGYLAECSDPVGAGEVVAIAQRPGQNGTAAGDKNSEVILAMPGMLLYMNFLTNAGATNALAATDLGTSWDIHMSAVHRTTDAVAGKDVFHGSDSTAGVTCKMVSFESDQQVPNQVVTDAVAGDSDARVIFQLLNSALDSDA